MRHLIYVTLFALPVGCGRSSGPPESSAAPSRSPLPQTSQPAPAEKTAALPEDDRLVADMVTLTDRMAEIVFATSGDCDALATDLRTLEPLATSIFSRVRERKATMTLEEKQRMAERFGGVKSAFEAKDPERARALDKKTSELATQCAGNAAVEDVLRRIGLKIWQPVSSARPATR
jgi:hypothetical protein